MLSIMESQLLDDHVNEEPPKEEAMETTSYQNWKKDNALIKSWIFGSLTKEVLYLITGLSTAREVWHSLEDPYAQITKDRERLLVTKLHSCRKAMQKPVSDDDKVNWLANGLGPKYFNFCDAQLSKPPTSTYSQFITALQNHELQNQAYTEEIVLDHHMAFMGQRGGRGSRFHGWGRGFSSQGREFVPSSQYYNSQGYSRNHSQPPFSNFQKGQPSFGTGVSLSDASFKGELSIIPTNNAHIPPSTTDLPIIPANNAHIPPNTTAPANSTHATHEVRESSTNLA
ncbi:hypothetical protein GIB67_018075 [Kingdonia uniflora]|uniref:Uncharacterized protein n=1 Tax=Kingdonia uniflora TaxID=39325 RepID=A0A7J7NWG4_9MAGN|nr:hypothetical protein GIB67_018075 [Kingdonia uniflora]